jgi:hypothetical protein
VEIFFEGRSNGIEKGQNNSIRYFDAATNIIGAATNIIGAATNIIGALHLYAYYRTKFYEYYRCCYCT